MFDPQPWLSLIDGENPSGVGLRNDLRFHELERLMQPRVEVVRDDRNNPVSQAGVPVDWTAVLETARQLSQSGRDLRLLVIVVRALANEDGFSGLGNGFDLIAKTIEAFWETLFPELRDSPSPRDAALRRINALLQMESDADGVLGDISRKIIFSPRGFGDVTGGDLEMGMIDGQTMLREAAQGLNQKEKAALAEKHDALVQRVKNACKARSDQDAAGLEALRSDAAAALAALGRMEDAVGQKLGSNGAGSILPGLQRFLKRVTATLDNTRLMLDANEPKLPPVTNVTSQTASVALPLAPATTGGGAIPDRLNSRGEVEMLLDLIIDFYDRTEPSSPIPHLARRIRRMVPMDFLALMEEMAPSGLKEFKSLAGVAEDKKA